MKKKVLSLLLALVMIVGLLPVSALASEGDVGFSSASVTVEPLTNLPSDWPSFRGNDQNNGVTSAATPRTNVETTQKWVKQISTGWSDIPSPMILVDGNIVTMAGSTLKKLSVADGSTVASAAMTAATSYGSTPPLYANGYIFCQLGGGKVQAFNADTLESLWVYTDENGGQAQSPIAYSDGKVYVGFGYNDQGTGSCSFVCLNATDGSLAWRDVDGYGYYWSGAVVVGDYVIYGTNGGNVISRNKTTGDAVSTLEVGNKVRSSICYDNGKIYFTDYAANLCCADLNTTTGELSNLTKVDCSAYGTGSTSTPVVYNGIAYIGVGGWSGGNNIVAVNVSTNTIAWAIEEPAYPQCSVLLSTAYEATDGYIYLYVTYNNNPGGINVIKAKADGSEATQETLYTPASDYQQYCICSVIADSDGTLYYKNDSGAIFALKNTAVDTVIGLIDAIGTVTLESEAAITAARTAYKALAAAQKAQVTNYATLTAAEDELDRLLGKIEVTLSGLHNAQVKSLKLYTYTESGKGEADLLADIIAGNSTYAVKLLPGDYWVDGYDANGDCNGGMKITVAQESSSFMIQRMYEIYATNGGWVKDTDYTLNVTVTDADGNARTIEPGQANNYGTIRTSCLFVVGDTVEATFTPIGDKAADYLTTTAKKTPTLNNNLTASIPQAYEITITAPVGSTIAAGTFTTYYVYTFADSNVTEDENGVTAVFRVPETSGNHFYRVQNPHGVTYWNFAKWTANTTIDVTAEDLNLNSETFTKDTVYRFDQNVYDMANIYLNANGQGYLNLDVGETFELNVFRNWMAIESFMNAKVGLPDMHYTVIDMEGDPSDVLTITPDANNSSVATMTANRAGTAIVLVTYDAMTHVPGQGGNKFSAIWPEFTGVIVVSVGADGSSIQTNMMMDRLDADTTALDAEHDILFYLGDAGASYSFKPEEGCTVTVNRSTVTDKMTFAGFTAEGVTVAGDGTVTVSGLTTGRHIIKVEKNGLANYQVITARQVSYVLQDANGNALAEDAEIHAGDTIKVQFTGLISPAEKLSGVYNFNFSLYYFGEDETSFRSNPGGSFGVYDFSGNPVRQNITITIPKYWDQSTYTLHGAIKLGGFAAAPIGGHRDVTYAIGKPVSFDATSAGMILSRLPDLTISLAETNFVDGKLAFEDSNGSEVPRTALTVSLTDSEGNKIVVADDGSFPCVAGDYTYTICGAGYRYTTGSFSIGADDTAVTKRITLVNTSVNAWDGKTETEPAQDEGVYQIATGAELAWFSAQNQKNTQDIAGKLTANIDLADYPWNNTLSNTSWTTSLDGNGYVVSGLNATRGLFGALGGSSQIKNLTIRGSVSGGGAVTGYASGSGVVIENCVNEAVINSTGNSVGGIVGYANTGCVIRKCVNTGAVTGGSNVGGIIGGFVGAATVEECYNTGAVAGGSNVGGVFGNGNYAVTIKSCYNTGAVSGTSNIGGVGGALTGPSYGSGTATLSDCYSVGSVTGTTNVGGLLGSFNSSKASVTRGYYLAAAAENDPIGEALDETAMKSADLREGFKLICNGYPALAWQTGVTEHIAGENPVVTASTCTEKGYTTYLCTSCGENFRKDYTEPLGHDFCEHEGVPQDCEHCVYTAPGCETEGSIVHTCRRDGCEVTKTDIIPATGHTPIDSSIQTYPAYKTYTCAVCEEENIVEWNDSRLAHMTMPSADAAVNMTDTGSYPWTWNGAEQRLQSSNVGVNSSTSTSAIEFTLNHGGSLKFDYAVSSEANYDKLTIKLNDETLVNAISGSNTGSVDKALAAGTYTLTMSFSKDSSSAGGSDMGWISGVVITALSEEEAANAANQAAAAPVIEAIATIGEVTLEKEQAIVAARAAYNALTGAQKALVTNEGVLTAAEAKLANLKNPGTTPDPEDGKITVTFRLIGAEQATQEVDMSVSDYAPAYVTWIKTKSYTLNENATVGDLFALALNSAGLTYEGIEGNYISSITAPAACGGYVLAEFTNGNSSGWMYTVNGSHPDRGLNDWTLFNGDEVVWHYVNDYRYEVEDWFGGSSGTASTWNKWLNAPDVNPTSGGSAATPDTKPGTSEGSTVVPEVTVKGDTAVATVTDKQITSAVDAVKDSGEKTIVIAPAGTDKTEEVSVELPKSAVQSIVKDTDAALSIKTDKGVVSIPNDTLNAINEQASGSNIQIIVVERSASDVTDKTISTDGAAIVEVTVKSGDKVITSFGGKSLTISIPAGSKHIEGQSYKVIAISSDGKTEVLTGKCVRTDGKLAVQVTTTHLTTFVATTETVMPFTDVKESDYYYDAVLWAFAKGITDGTSATTFSPDAGCTRAQMVTFLWRAADCPEPTAKTSVFTDVDETEYYFKALLWAFENGITDGTGDNTFSPNAICTRAQMATFLYRNAKRPAVSGTSAFTDVKAGEYYSDAVVWFAQQGITDGTTKTTFSPDAACTRGQMVTFLYRYLEK